MMTYNWKSNYQAVWFRVEVQRVVHGEDPDLLVVEPPRPRNDGPYGVPDVAKLALVRRGYVGWQGELEGHPVHPGVQIEGF